ncbi:MAG: hypothetical protein ACI9FG_000176 [Crocinitomicaceae bacterium]|jgi:hypothetical protein
MDLYTTTLSNAPFWPIVVAMYEVHFDLWRGLSINLAGRFGKTSLPASHTTRQ